MKHYTPQEVLAVFLDMDTPKTSKDTLTLEILRYESFILQEVDLSLLDAGYTDEERLNKYIELKTSPPPILLNRQLWILDGFHRVKSQKAIGKTHIWAFIGQGEEKY